MAKININQPFFQFMNTLAAFILLNILFLISCLPIFTIGAALTSLYSVTMAYAKDEQGYLIKHYFISFKNNFKQATAIWMILLLLSAILVFNMAFWHAMGSLLGTIVFVLVGLVLILTLLCYLYVFPLIGRFSNSTFQSIKNAIFIAFQNLKYTILFVLLHSLCLFLIYTFVPVALLFFLFGFAFMAYVQSFLFNRIFKKYEPA